MTIDFAKTLPGLSIKAITRNAPGIDIIIKPRLNQPISIINSFFLLHPPKKFATLEWFESDMRKKHNGAEWIRTERMQCGPYEYLIMEFLIRHSHNIVAGTVLEDQYGDRTIQVTATEIIKPA